MASQARAREAVLAWKEHLITEHEALEIAGAESEADLFAAAGFRDEAPEGSSAYRSPASLRSGAEAGAAR